MNETVSFLKNQLDSVSNEPDGFRVDETFWAEVYNLISMYEQAASVIETGEQRLSEWERKAGEERKRYEECERSITRLIEKSHMLKVALSELLKTASPHLIPVGMESSYLTVKLEKVHEAYKVLHIIDAASSKKPR